MNEPGGYNISMTQVLNFKVIVEQDEDGMFVASTPSVSGCMTQGKTYEEVITNIKEALELVLEEAKNNHAYAEKIDLTSQSKKTGLIGIVDIPITFAF